MDDAISLVLQFVVVASVPVLLGLLLCADELIDRSTCAVAEWRQSRRERRLVARLRREVGALSATGRADLAAIELLTRPSIEQVATDLRRLGARRLAAPPDRPSPPHDALLRDYDDRLRLASGYLGVEQHLDELTGVDRDIERVRVEGELQAAGLVLPSCDARPRRRAR